MIKPGKKMKLKTGHQALRRLVQLGFALFILVTIAIQLIVGEESGTITASAEAFCPFGGLETLYTRIPRRQISQIAYFGLFPPLLV